MARNSLARPAVDSMAQRLRKMSREARVNIAAEMSSTVAAVAMDFIQDQNPGISKAKLLELARRRFESGRRVR